MSVMFTQISSKFQIIPDWSWRNFQAILENFQNVETNS